MKIKQIFDFIRDRCGEENRTYVLREINYAITRTWLTTDLPGSLYDMVVVPADERILILPWYVMQVKAVKRYGGAEVTLYTPRATFQDNAWRQDLLTWVFLSDTPLLRPLTNIGRITAKLLKPEATPFSVTMVGPSDYGSRQLFELDFMAGDKQQQTTEVLRDITSLSKSRVTETDVELFDVTGQKIAVIPAERTDVYNKQIRIKDLCTQTTNTPCNRFHILYKTHAPVFTDEGGTEAIDDSTGIIIQNLVAAELLSKDEKQVRRMAYHGRMGEAMLNEAQQRDNEGKSMKVKVPREPFTHEFYGYL